VRDVEIRHEVTPRLPRAWRRVLAIGCGDCLAVVPGVDGLTDRGSVWAYLVSMPGASRALTAPSRSGIRADDRLRLALDDAADVGEARSVGNPPEDPVRWFDGLVDIHHTNCAAHGLSHGHVPLEDQLRVIQYSQAVARPVLERTIGGRLPILQRIIEVRTGRWLFGRED